MTYGYTCPKCGTFHAAGYAKNGCSKCTEPFLDMAGTHEQKYILFIGKPNSGKYNAMVALTNALNQHYKIQPLDPPDLRKLLHDYRFCTPSGKSSGLDTITMLLEAEGSPPCLLTLACIPWNYQAKDSAFSVPGAYVLCWDTKADFDHHLFSREKSDLLWTLESTPLQGELEAFASRVGKDYLCASVKPEDDIADLCRRISQLQPTASAKDTAPILLLYNKHDTIPAEKWRISAQEDLPPDHRPMLRDEIVACSKIAAFPELAHLSSTITPILKEKFLHACFYAQMRFSPYGGDIITPDSIDRMNAYIQTAKAIELFLRLHRYAQQYKNPELSAPDKQRLENAITKYKSFTSKHMPADSQKAIRETAKALLKDLHSGTFSKSDQDRVDNAHRQAERNLQLACHRLECTQARQQAAPQNADMLAKWLLYAAGILPIPLKELDAKSKELDTKMYLLPSPEYRSNSPEKQLSFGAVKSLSRSQSEALLCEAAARLYLFENPHEKDYLYFRDQKNIKKLYAANHKHEAKGAPK